MDKVGRSYSHQPSSWERRGKEWLEEEEKELERDMTFAKQIWSLIPPTDQEVTTKDYEEKVKQLLETHLRALTGA
jgi:hypothetical protein